MCKLPTAMARLRLGALLLSLWLLPTGGAGAEEGFEDPWEGFNRQMHALNMTADRYVLKPVAQGYRFVTPEVVQDGVGNVFGNLLDVPSALNSLLQGKPASALEDSTRFLINSTIGLGGVFDVASRMGLDSGGREDFGQTLAVWGVDSGPYLVLPFFGASTVRDAAGMPVDWVTDPVFFIEDDLTRYGVRAVYYTEKRSQLMELEKHLTGDHYVFIRDAYLQRREYLVNDGEVEDDFGSGMDMGEYGDYGDGDEEGADPF